MILAIATPLFAIVCILFVIWLLSFRVTKIDPSPVPIEGRQITIYFSRGLDKNYDTKKITLSREIKGSYSVGENSITFRPSEELTKGDLIFTFNNLRSITGDEATVTAKTTVKYVPFNQLSDDEQQRQINESDSNQRDYPITNGVLPHATSSWGAGYLLPEDTDADKLTITVKIFTDRGTNEPLVDYHARLEVAYTDFVNYIQSKGFKTTDYYILFENSYLAKYDQPAPNEY